MSKSIEINEITITNLGKNSDGEFSVSVECGSHYAELEECGMGSVDAADAIISWASANGISADHGEIANACESIGIDF